MLKNIIHKIITRRHTWRTIGFDELSVLYTSTMMRSLSISLIGIFVPIYLYKLGNPLEVVFLFMAMLFFARMFADIAAGYVVAWWGPKHTILVSYIGHIVTFLLLLTLPSYNWPLLMVAAIWGVANSLFFIAYHVDFSKIIHRDHGGKELGAMTIFERAGSALGPVVGGVIASVFGAQYTIAAAMLILVVAVIPLLRNAEPVKTRQKVHFGGLPFWSLKRDFLSYAALCNSHNVSAGMWPLFLAVTVFIDQTYAAVGLVTTIGIIAAVVSARLIGRVVDRNQGGQLLKLSAIGSGLTNLIRPLVTGMGGAIAVNVVDQAVISGYKMPYTKGMYDRSDSLPGQRIAYLVVMEAVGDAGKMLSWLVLLALAAWLPPVAALQVSFVLAGVVVYFVTTQNFPALKRR